MTTHTLTLPGCPVLPSSQEQLIKNTYADSFEIYIIDEHSRLRTSDVFFSLIIIDEFTSGKSTIKFKAPIAIHKTIFNINYYRLVFSSLNIDYLEEKGDAEDCIDSIKEVLDYYYESYFLTPDELLMGDALKYKRWFTNNIRFSGDE